MRVLFLHLRAWLFYGLYVVFTIVYSLLAVTFIGLLPHHRRFDCIAFWNRTVLALAALICGIRYRVHGLENLPRDTPYVVLSNHQSSMETFVLLMMLKPVSIILKQELMKIPGFGWGLRMLKPIPIDRNNPKKSIRQIRQQGLERLQNDRWPVLIFPQGTRLAVGQSGRYARSGAALAIEAGVPLVLIAHNAGYFWPSQSKIKYPGTVDFYISPALASEGQDAKQLTEQARLWIEAHIQQPDPLPDYRH